MQLSVMAPQDGDPEERGETNLAEQPGHRRWVERAVRHDLRLPLRYRLEGQQDWRFGETINMSESGVLFSTNEVLEIDARVEITFQTSGIPLLQSSTRAALVVRRILSNWPETRLVLGARFRL
jgi:PilZ domain